MKKKVVLALLATLLCLQTVGTAYAEVNETQTIDQQEVNDVGGSTSASAEVEALIPSNFTITVPKKITMDGEHGTADYTVMVKGDIPGTGVINVVPDSSFTMSAFRKDNITANVTQDKTAFAQAELTEAGDTGVTEAGHIAAEGMSPGVWKGTLNFNISTENVGGYDVSKLHIEDYDYSVNQTAKEVKLIKYKGTDPNVVVPAYFADEDGYRYKTALSAGLFASTNVTSVSFEKGIKIGNDTLFKMFQEAGTLQTADLSNLNLDKVENINYLFNGCTALQSVNFGDNTLPNLKNTSFAFNNCQSLTSLDISKWNMSNLETDEGMFQYCNGLETLKLPETVNRIDNFMFNHMESLQGESFTLPKGIKYIGNTHIFYNFGTFGFNNFISPEDNDVYTTYTEDWNNQNCLYSADKKTLISIPKGKTDANPTFSIPDGVTDLAGLAFNRNYNIHGIRIPNSFVIKPTEDAAGNKGSNLHVGIYTYCTAYYYFVNDDNPNYSAVGGCIYNKDKTKLIAVPFKYKGKPADESKYSNDGMSYDGTLTIPEGVTEIGEDAIYAQESSHIGQWNKLVIPSTLTTIPADQLKAINTMLENNRLTITIADGNTHFEVVDNQLVAK